MLSSRHGAKEWLAVIAKKKKKYRPAMSNICTVGAIRTQMRLVVGKFGGGTCLSSSSYVQTSALNHSKERCRRHREQQLSSSQIVERQRSPVVNAQSSQSVGLDFGRLAGVEEAAGVLNYQARASVCIYLTAQANLHFYFVREQ